MVSLGYNSRTLPKDSASAATLDKTLRGREAGLSICRQMAPLRLKLSNPCGCFSFYLAAACILGDGA